MLYEFCDYPELVGFPLEHVTELIVFGKRMSSVAVNKIGAVGKNIYHGYCFFPANSQLYATNEVSLPWFFSL